MNNINLNKISLAGHKVVMEYEVEELGGKIQREIIEAFPAPLNYAMAAGVWATFCNRWRLRLAAVMSEGKENRGNEAMIITNESRKRLEDQPSEYCNDKH